MMHQNPSTHRPSGFALVATISMMVILTVVAVGLLSLSTIALKSSTGNSAREHARANARMALMMAIGELQEYTGQDMRITAPADIVEEDAPLILGVWKSWEGSDHDATGRPIPPDYGSKSGNRFLTWLVSGASAGEAPTNPGSLAATTPSAQTVEMVADGTLGEGSTREVHLVPVPIREDGGRIDSGRYAWWVSGENQKARLTQPYEPRANSPAGYAEKGQSHTVPNPESFGLASLTEDREPHNPNTAALKPVRKVMSRLSMALIDQNNAVEPEQQFHDFTSDSVGLLTNSATGGWRKDLSLLTEKWDDIYSSYPGGRLPLFRILPESDTAATTRVPKPTTSNYDPAQSNLYPWSEYSVILGYKQPATYYAASASWASLQSFATSYKNFSNDSGVVTSPFVWDRIAKQRASSITSREIYNHKHRQRLHPQIARFQFIVYARAVDDPNQTDPSKYEIWLKYVPIFTLWNPYNVALEHEISGTENGGQGSGTHTNFLGFGFRRSAPGAMAIEPQSSFPNPDSVPTSRYKLLTSGNFQTLDWPSNYANPYDNSLPSNGNKYGYGQRWLDARSWGCWLPEGTLTFQPGEAKIFSPDYIDSGYGFGGTAMRLKEGYNPTNIVGSEFRIKRNEPVNRAYWFLFRPDRVTQPYRDREPGAGFSLSFGDGGSHFGGTSVHPGGVGTEYHNITALTSEAQGNAYWPPDEVDEVGYSVGELSGPWIPLFSTSFGPRMTIGTGSGTKQNRPTKGVTQNNALAAMVLSDPGSGEAKDHPANNTFDFAYHSLSIGSTITPNLSDSKAFIGTGYQSGDGLSRLIMAEIPLRPMASLVELQGWNPRGNNPYPPFQMNLIGNSDATPLIPKNGVVPSTLSPSGTEFNLQHDDAYCANHLLFDDWFVSSIVPQVYDFGGQTTKDITTFYQDFLRGDDQLTNRAYQKITEDSNLEPSQISELSDEIIESHDGWLKVASRFEVEGMFNVNSTSVEAWKALLGHAKVLDEVAVHGADGIISTDTGDKHIVTRGPVASDIEAGSGSGFGGEFANASEYTGYRSLSNDQIEDLAEKIVEQVRRRGPFLSLSEFVNRELSNNTNRALAGAIQSAINTLEEDPMAVLSNPANSLSDDTLNPSDPKLNGADYKFLEAADGSSAYGAPGWIRQADILRPIAPVLTVRDDTFTIRAYGDYLDEKGNVVARAWCEAVVQRTRDFCDESDPADSIDPPISPTNEIYGRRYIMTSFRWLNSNEI